MKYVMRALVTGKHSFGRKVLHFVTVVAAAMLFLNSPTLRSGAANAGSGCFYPSWCAAH